MKGLGRVVGDDEEEEGGDFLEVLPPKRAFLDGAMVVGLGGVVFWCELGGIL